MSSKNRVGIFPQEDRKALFNLARRLGYTKDPYPVFAVFSRESGSYLNPNAWGGDGGGYYGIIQMGENERRRYLDPNKIGKYTRAEQVDPILKFLTDRGYKPGMSINQLYSTILRGNPYEADKSDSWGTTPNKEAPRFLPGGDLYNTARKNMGDIETVPGFGSTSSFTTNKPTQSTPPSTPTVSSIPGVVITINNGPGPYGEKRNKNSNESPYKSLIADMFEKLFKNNFGGTNYYEQAINSNDDPLDDYLNYG